MAAAVEELVEDAADLEDVAVVIAADVEAVSREVVVVAEVSSTSPRCSIPTRIGQFNRDHSCHIRRIT